MADDGTNGSDPTPANNTGTDTTPVTAAPDLTVSKTDGGVSATAGRHGGVHDQLQQRGRPRCDGCGADGDDSGQLDVQCGRVGGGLVVWRRPRARFTLGGLAAGAGGTVTFAVTVAAPLPAGVHQIDNTVTIADDGTNGSDPTPANNTGTDTTPDRRRT